MKIFSGPTEIKVYIGLLDEERELVFFLNGLADLPYERMSIEFHKSHPMLLDITKEVLSDFLQSTIDDTLSTDNKFVFERGELMP
jgi:hypothetical protein